jgi:hemoglobin
MLTQCLFRRASNVLLVLILVLLFNITPNIAEEEKSLYQRLGGYDTVAAVIDDFFKRMMGDPTLGRFFIGLSTDSKRRAQQLTVDFVCSATGGPCLYTGRDMKTAHTGLGITENDWQVSVNLLVATLDKFKVPAKEKNELLNLVSSLKGSIVSSFLGTRD